MSRTIFTHEDHHLGDQLIHLHLLRALAKSHVSTPFVHFCHGCHIVQLQEVVADLPNILLEPFESPLWMERRSESVCCWKNWNDRWVNSPQRWDWSAHTLKLHERNAERMGFTSPFTCREHLLFDWSALEVKDNNGGQYPYDFLIGDSAPASGQYREWADHSKTPLDTIIRQLSGKYRVITTSQIKLEGHNISYIGRISQLCRHHIMVANGPFWTTLNTANHHCHEGRKRIALLDPQEQLNMPNILQISSAEEVTTLARNEGWI